jgi:hypothetical protein
MTAKAEFRPCPAMQPRNNFLTLPALKPGPVRKGNPMRMFVAAVLASSLFVSNVYAADVSPLAPGRPAGIKGADIEAGGVLLWAGIVGLAVGIAILATNTQGHSSATTTQ